MPVVNITIDSQPIEAASGQTILQAALSQGIFVPNLCHNERIKAFGACGVCVVEVENYARLMRACSTQVEEGMEISTCSPRVEGARKAAIELLFSDHEGDCRAPCMLECPAGTDCQGYVGLVANREYSEASKLIKEKLPLPSSIGRICPHPCEDACRRQSVDEPINISGLKYFATDMFLGQAEPVPEQETGKSVAIIGGGPGGLSAASFLRKMGHSVDIYDAMPQMGGMLRYGIPAYRLPKDILDIEVAAISKMGARFFNNTRIGGDIAFESLRGSYNAVIIAIGAWKSSKLGCSGEDLEGVNGGIDFLRAVAMGQAPPIGVKTAIVGGGNTAMDAARTAVRLGAKEVSVLYRRSRDEMPASEIEIKEAEEEGVIFRFLSNPIEIIGASGKVSRIRLQKMELGEPDASGRRSPQPIEGAEENLDVDSVIMAIGQSADTSGIGGIELTRWGTVIADTSSFRTSLEGVYAIGDVINDGAGIAVAAIGHAQQAVLAVDAFLSAGICQQPNIPLSKTNPEEDFYSSFGKSPRVEMRHLSPSQRRRDFREINNGYNEEEAVAEASRCLECGCADYFSCKLANLAWLLGCSTDQYAGQKAKRSGDFGHPFIQADPAKCILCGLCSRACEELVGACALGIAGRGFDSQAAPAFGELDGASGCISCGACAALCPTGALVDRAQGTKQVPLVLDKENSVCSFCSVGCQVQLEYKGGMLARIMPAEGSELCGKGRFGFTETTMRPRLEYPLFNKQKVGWGDALKYASCRMEAVIASHGTGAAAIALSDRLSNEELSLAKEYARRLGISAYSFNRRVSGVAGDASTCGFERLENADLIILASSDIMSSHTVAGFKIRRSALDGAKLIQINGEKLEGVAVDYLEASSLEELVASGSLDGYLAGAKRPVAVFEQGFLGAKAESLLAKTALAGNAEVIQLKPNANSQGLADLGIGYGYCLEGALKNGTIKGLVILGEDPGWVDFSSVAFLCVGDVFETETTKKAQLVLPLAAFGETDGTYTNTVGQTKALAKVFEPACKYSNLQTIQGLIDNLDASIPGLPPSPPPSQKLEAIEHSGVMYNTNAIFNRFSDRLKSI
ncbi:MAG: FAD-dependent oxidoreductase [Eubacteriaceae bacterium]|nr:FAD-dependent oxidoreductase [Eubacteriaceae bacterium]